MPPGELFRTQRSTAFGVASDAEGSESARAVDLRRAFAVSSAHVRGCYQQERQGSDIQGFVNHHAAKKLPFVTNMQKSLPRSILWTVK